MTDVDRVLASIAMVGALALAACPTLAQAQSLPRRPTRRGGRPSKWPRCAPRWLPTRAIQVGCNLSHDTRSVSQVGNPYTSNGVSCYGQFVLQ
jgi:hypothetical protein